MLESIATKFSEYAPDSVEVNFRGEAFNGDVLIVNTNFNNEELISHHKIYGPEDKEISSAIVKWKIKQ